MVINLLAVKNAKIKLKKALSIHDTHDIHSWNKTHHDKTHSRDPMIMAY